jgi:hypothetical protein
MSDERGISHRPPIDFSGIRNPDSGTWNPTDPLEKVNRRKEPYNASHPSEEVKNQYEQETQREYYSERLLNATDRNYKARVIFEEQLQPKLGVFVNIMALKILTVDNAGNDIVAGVREQLTQFLFPDPSLHKTVSYDDSLKKLCDEITKNFPEPTHDQKLWILQWIEDKLRKKKVKKSH